MKRLALLLVASLALAVPALAQAADGFVIGNVNLRAGPDSAYPLILTVPVGTPVNIQGCTSGWEWCDVITLGARGWVAGTFIQYQYQNQPVMVQEYGASIGIPIVSFVIGSYWSSYYSNRPFYRQRNDWYRRRIISRPPTRPVHRPPSRPQPGHGSRPPPTRPGMGNPGQGQRPPPAQGNRPQPGQGNRPTPGPGNRPPPAQSKPGQGNRPQSGQGNRPAPGQGNRPPPAQGKPGQGSRPGNRPAQGQGTPPKPKPQARPAPADKNNNGN